MADCAAGLSGESRSNADREASGKLMSKVGDWTVIGASPLLATPAAPIALPIVTGGALTSFLGSIVTFANNTNDANAIGLAVNIATMPVKPFLGAVIGRSVDTIYDARDAMVAKQKKGSQ